MNVKRKNIKQRLAYLLILLIPALMFASCDHSYIDAIDDMEDYSYSPAFALPLVNTSISLDDLVDLDVFDQFEVDEENLITLVYSGRIFSVPASGIFSINSQSQTFTFDNIYPVDGEPVTLPSQLFLITFENSESLNYIRFREGLYSVIAESEFLAQDGYSMDASFTILNSEDTSGQPISGSFSLDNPAEIDLAGSSISFDDQPNVFLVEYVFTISGDGSPDNAPYAVDFIQNMTGIEYDMVRGYIDQISFPVGSTTIGIGIFENALFGNIMFENPSIDFTISNSFGAEIYLFVNDFFAASNEDIITISGPVIDNPWLVDAPETPEEFQKITNVVVDRDNTNLFDVIMESPREIYYEIEGLINPIDTISENWISHDSDLSMDIDVRLPMWASINTFTIQDTSDVDLGELSENVEWLELRVETNNGFPLGVEIRGILVDENMEHIDTLFKNQPHFISAAPVDPFTSIVTEPTVSVVNEMLSAEMIEKLIASDKLIIDAQLSSWDADNGTTVKLLDSYRLGLKMGIRGKGNYVIEF